MPQGECLSLRNEGIVDNTLVKAIARAHRWQCMLDAGSYASISEIAAAERINSSYMTRLLRLTLLAPTWWRPSLTGAAQI
jgi:hypothetical protein